jgi:hypothetical protein
MLAQLHGRCVFLGGSHREGPQILRTLCRNGIGEPDPTGAVAQCGIEFLYGIESRAALRARSQMHLDLLTLTERPRLEGVETESSLVEVSHIFTIRRSSGRRWSVRGCGSN